MLFAEKESNLIEMFQDLSEQVICLLPETDEMVEVLNCIRTPEEWSKWTHSFGKDAPPPDFFSDELELMMEVMRVDDHGFKKKGHIINPVYEKEHQLEKELKDLGILDAFPNAQLHITATTDLDTEDDHNYKRYVDNFARTVKHHISKIENYRVNHPNHKLIFFVFDESSAYFENYGGMPNNSPVVEGKPHLFMFDKAFTDVFMHSTGLDYLIWMTPYKHIDFLGKEMVLPTACAYKIGEKLPELIKYDTSKMVSTER